MSLKKSIILIIIGILCVGSTYYIGAQITKKQTNIISFDKTVSNLSISTKTPDRTGLMRTITSFGNTDPIIEMTLIFMVLMIIIKYWKLAASAAFGVLIISIITNFLKEFFVRGRPTEMLIGAGGYSYPSGHTTSITMLCFMIAWFFISFFENKIIRWAGIIVSVAIALTISSSRIFLNVHWFSDVIGGILLSVGVGLIIVGITGIISRNEQK